jgi:hypothetical protein
MQRTHEIDERLNAVHVGTKRRLIRVGPGFSASDLLRTKRDAEISSIKRDYRVPVVRRDIICTAERRVRT